MSIKQSLLALWKRLRHPPWNYQRCPAGEYHHRYERYCHCRVGKPGGEFKGGSWDLLKGQEVPEEAARKPVECNVIIYAGASYDRVQFTCGDRVAIEIGPDGFWVDGEEVPQDKDKALAVYNAFIDWCPMTARLP